MNSVVRIKALSLLLLMLSMMLHGVIPHVHHDHEGGHHVHPSVLAEHHHHEHSHHEHSGQDHEHSLLLGLKDTHSHDSHVHEFLQLEFTTPNYDQVAVNHVAEVPDATLFNVSDSDEGTVLFQAFKEFRYHDPDLYSRSLRGPPVLG